ncbi:hypothetical protein VNO80_10615 [Phaseolus coccineus]|uniref:Uncharacterized protein n=1 Tax=Phaseolus coccineus TaxID=3886 RepID=A0AAN9NDR2_PHACN
MIVFSGAIAGGEVTKPAAVRGASGDEFLSSLGTVCGTALPGGSSLFVDLRGMEVSCSTLSKPFLVHGGGGAAEVGSQGWGGEVEGLGREADEEVTGMGVNAASMRKLSGTGKVVPTSSDRGSDRKGGKVSRALFSGSDHKTSSNQSSASVAKNSKRLFRKKNEHVEAIRMWNIGKEQGFSFNGEEEIVIRSLKALEKRDSDQQWVVRRESSISDDEMFRAY